MNKGQLVDAVAADLEETKANAARVIDVVIKCIARGVDEHGAVTISGFGTFTKKDRPARTGRNPSTGELMEIKASKTVTFRASQLLKDIMNAPVQ